VTLNILQNKNRFTKYTFLSLSAVFVLLLVSIPSLAFSDGSITDGFFTKYSSDGKYQIEMKWSPSGEMKPDTDYFVMFTIKDAHTQTSLDESSFNLEITQNDKSINTYLKELDSSIFAKKFLFTDSGIVNFVLSDINNSDQNVKFSMKLGSEQSSLVKDTGFTSKRKVDGKPVIFACGFEKNAITLQKCYETQTYDDYGWFGKVNFIIYAPGWNQDSNKVETIGGTEADKLTLSSRSDNHPYQELGKCGGFSETGADTGLFVGRVKLSGHDHDVNGDGVLDTKFGKTKCSNSPIDEYAKIEAGRKGAVTLTWQYQDDPVKVVSKSINFHWNVGELNFLQNLYNVDDTIEFTFYDRDMYKAGEKEFDLNFKVYSDSDQAGIEIQTGQNYKFKDPFSFTVNTEKTVGTSLRVSDGDTIYVQYDDCTLPVAYDKFGFTYSDDACVEVIAKTLVYTY
jgi:hypothetical protein